MSQDARNGDERHEWKGEGRGMDIKRKTRRKSDDIARRFTRTYANAAQRAHTAQLNNVYGYIHRHYNLQFLHSGRTADNIFR